MAAFTLRATLFVGALLAAASCGGGAQSADAPIGIETTQLAVTIENRAGVPLLDVTVGVVGSGMTFTKTIPRVDNAQRLPLTIDQFTAPDGTHLNLRAVNPTSVRVTATGVSDEKYDVETRWR